MRNISFKIKIIFMFYIVLLSVFLGVSNTHAFVDSDQYGEYSVLPPISIEYNSSGISVKYYGTTKWQESAVSSIVNVEQMWIQPLTSTSVAIHLVREGNLNGYSRTISNLNSSVYVSSWYTWSTKDTGTHIMDYDSDELFFQIGNEDVYYFSGQELPLPTNLTQSISMPDPNDTEGDGDYRLAPEDIGVGTELGYKIGRFQSGSGVILGATIDNTKGGQVKLAVDVYRLGEGTPTYTQESDFFTTGYAEVIISYLGVGDYYWKTRTVGESGNSSDSVDYGTNSIWEADYALFEGFEPYPYGYSFENNTPELGLLTGGIDGFNIGELYDNRQKVNGGKWEIFELVFPLSVFGGDTRKQMDGFESIGLNNTNPPIFYGGNCFGLSWSALNYFYNPNTLLSEFPDFYNIVNGGNIWSSIEEPIVAESKKWNNYNQVFKTILAYQLYQKGATYLKIQQESLKNDKPIDILNTVKQNPQQPYILSISGKKCFFCSKSYHAVVPYKVEDNRIYIWDNNVPLSEVSTESPYNQYIIIDGDDSWSSDYYSRGNFNWDYFTELSLVNINEVYETELPGFNNVDEMIIFSGQGDMYIENEIGDISGFIEGDTINNIPGVNVVRPLNVINDGVIFENTWKQIYIPQKRDDLTIYINGKVDEEYTFMVAGGDYYTKVEGVSTSSGQIDTFVSTRIGLEIDFDDNKTGDYNLLIDNFYNSGTGTVYLDSIQSTPLAQQYNFDWDKVRANDTDAVTYTIDEDNNGLFDETSVNLPPVYQDLEAPTTTIELDGTETPTSTGFTYYDTVGITLTASDNTDGSGVKETYYVIGTGTGELTYLSYTDTLTINGVGEYTFNYYSIDNLGNIEDNQVIDFTLVERPETYAGKISGYTFFDENQNQLWDSDEETNAGWKVCIDVNNNNSCEENTETFMVTNNTGYYEFDGLATGTYIILVVPRQNWIITTPTTASYTINLSNAEIVTDQNFGNYKAKGKK